MRSPSTINLSLNIKALNVITKLLIKELRSIILRGVFPTKIRRIISD